MPSTIWTQPARVPRSCLPQSAKENHRPFRKIRSLRGLRLSVADEQDGQPGFDVFPGSARI
jgi:hypothetical protein